MSEAARKWSHQDRYRFRPSMELMMMEAHFDAGWDAAKDAVMAIHKPLIEDGRIAGCAACDWEQPGQNGWPCLTVQALRQELPDV